MTLEAVFDIFDHGVNAELHVRDVSDRLHVEDHFSRIVVSEIDIALQSTDLQQLADGLDFRRMGCSIDVAVKVERGISIISDEWADDLLWQRYETPFEMSKMFIAFFVKHSSIEPHELNHIMSNRNMRSVRNIESVAREFLKALDTLPRKSCAPSLKAGDKFDTGVTNPE
ncbi:uncharacterized protein Z518_04389 [Rhinocladiella mackenziei CBS 650.93]|uniref:Uncharacterized protein n=1 Tax=Rhinocladiella mackenziei CBS 650.93 TaxID=1442369 RepID=A0A0D2H7P5_9EURO|nr:uncharacterized protein Z518_04389 [Rhinocladiella mackenziei CBS 650.93]KIX06413.1 hypothetical protein Z518_04389 [Rhinocladiella mackenziei CBS 650.93]